MQREFGYPSFASNGEMVITTYDNAYSHMNMDVRVVRLAAGEKRTYKKDGEETAFLLLAGRIKFAYEGKESDELYRKDVFTDGPWCLHVCTGKEVTVIAVSDAELLIQATHNDQEFASKLYSPEDAPWKRFAPGKYGNVANRVVSTIIDKDIAPWSNMVLGEILNDRGNWSGYLPHRHPQPELYFFRFDRPEGFGASFVGDDVYKIRDYSFAAIPGGKLHPQACAPGFVMYTCWMIRHIDGNPWLQTDRCVDDSFLFLDDMDFNN